MVRGRERGGTPSLRDSFIVGMGRKVTPVGRRVRRGGSIAPLKCQHKKKKKCLDPSQKSYNPVKGGEHSFNGRKRD